MNYSKIFKKKNEQLRITVGQSELLDANEIVLLNVEVKKGRKWINCPFKYASEDDIYLTKLEYWLTIKPNK